jgi:ATP-dependent Lhr-like helicase
MLYQQIVSNVAAAGELSPQALENIILSMQSFRHISEDDFMNLVMHLVELDHLQVTEERGLIIGLEGEKIVNTYKFFAVFPEEEAWVIMDGSKKIGTVEVPVPPSKYLTIAGITWIVTAVDNEKRLIFVEKTKRNIQLLWLGDRAIIHNRILQRMKQVLFEDVEYPYLQDAAKECLRKSRKLAREYEIDKNNIIDLGNNAYCLFPWMGHISYYTLVKIIKKYMEKAGDDACCIKQVSGIRPYFITFKTAGGKDEFLNRLKAILNSSLTAYDIVDERDIRQLKKQFEYKEPKYDKFITSDLLKKQVIEDYIDLDFLRKEVNSW